MDKIYFTEDDCPCESTCEAMPTDYDKIFLNMVCNSVVEALQVPYQSREIVKNLLYSNLKDKVCSRGGWLEQFLHSELDKIAQSIKSKFDLKKELKVDYNYAAHAKLASIMDAIEDKFENMANEIGCGEENKKSTCPYPPEGYESDV